MPTRTITVQAPLTIPQPPRSGTHFLHVFGTDNGFTFRWVALKDCPIYIRAKTGEKARLSMSLTNRISDLPTHGKVVLTFQEILVRDKGAGIYSDWDPNEWFPYLTEDSK